MYNIVVAYDDNRVIGYKNKLPWYISDDLEYFSKITDNSAVIMGYNTWLSLSHKPLSNRVNIVVSNATRLIVEHNDVHFVRTFNGALTLCSLKFSDKKIFVIGGQHIYTEALNPNKLYLIGNIYITHVFGIHNGDRFFPLLPNANWRVNRVNRNDKYERLIINNNN